MAGRDAGDGTSFGHGAHLQWLVSEPTEDIRQIYAWSGLGFLGKASLVARLSCRSPQVRSSAGATDQRLSVPRQYKLDRYGAPPPIHRHECMRAGRAAALCVSAPESRIDILVPLARKIALNAPWVRRSPSSCSPCAVGKAVKQNLAGNVAEGGRLVYKASWNRGGKWKSRQRTKLS